MCDSKKSSAARDLFSQTHTDGVPLLVSHSLVSKFSSLFSFARRGLLLLMTIMACLGEHECLTGGGAAGEMILGDS